MLEMVSDRVITFDDVLFPLYTLAFPLLIKMKIPADILLTTPHRKRALMT